MATDRKILILDAFMKLVSRFGLDKTTMQDVAKEAGVSVGVIYKDFSNKEDLINAYIGNLLNQMIQECRTLINPEKPAEDLLHEFIIGYFRIIGMMVTRNLAFCQLLSENPGIRFLQHTDSYKQLLEREIAGLIEKILVKGISEHKFLANDPHETSILFLNAFGTYMIEVALEMKSLDVVLPKVEKMYQFIIRALRI